jgi:ATP-dependent HslUV protease subunit HslV
VGDCLTLIEHLEGFIEGASGNLTLACINLVKAWRTDKFLRNLSAQLCVADKKNSFIV